MGALADLLRDKRGARARVARQAECSFRSIRLAERGELRSLQAAERIAAVTGCPIAEMMPFADAGAAREGDNDGDEEDEGEDARHP